MQGRGPPGKGEGLDTRRHFSKNAGTLDVRAQRKRLLSLDSSLHHANPLAVRKP